MQGVICIPSKNVTFDYLCNNVGFCRVVEKEQQKLQQPSPICANTNSKMPPTAALQTQSNRTLEAPPPPSPHPHIARGGRRPRRKPASFKFPNCSHLPKTTSKPRGKGWDPERVGRRRWWGVEEEGVGREGGEGQSARLGARLVSPGLTPASIGSGWWVNAMRGDLVWEDRVLKSNFPSFLWEPGDGSPGKNGINKKEKKMAEQRRGFNQTWLLILTLTLLKKILKKKTKQWSDFLNLITKIKRFWLTQISGLVDWLFWHTDGFLDDFS